MAKKPQVTIDIDSTADRSGTWQRMWDWLMGPDAPEQEKPPAATLGDAEAENDGPRRVDTPRS